MNPNNIQQSVLICMMLLCSLFSFGQDSTVLNTEPSITVDSVTNYIAPIQKTFIKIDCSSWGDNRPRPSINFILDGELDSLRNIFLLQLKVDSSEFGRVERTVKSKFKKINADLKHGVVGIRIVKDFKEEQFVFYDIESIKELLDELSIQFKGSDKSKRLDFYLNDMLRIYHLNLKNYSPDTSYQIHRRADSIQRDLDNAGDSINTILTELGINRGSLEYGKYRIGHDTSCPDNCNNLTCCNFGGFIMDTISDFLKIYVYESILHSGKYFRFYYDHGNLIKSVEFDGSNKGIYYFTKEDNQLDGKTLIGKSAKPDGRKFQLLRKARVWSEELRTYYQENSRSVLYAPSKPIEDTVSRWIEIYSTEDFSRYRRSISFGNPIETDTSNTWTGLYRFNIDSSEFENLYKFINTSECKSSKYLLNDAFEFNLKSGSKSRIFQLSYRECIRSILEKIPYVFNQEYKRRKVQEAVIYYLVTYNLNYK
jgi:hypothetical protein